MCITMLWFAHTLDNFSAKIKGNYLTVIIDQAGTRGCQGEDNREEKQEWVSIDTWPMGRRGEGEN